MPLLVDRQADLGLVASPIRNSRPINKRLHLKNQGGWSEEQHQRPTSGLHVHAYVHIYTYTYIENTSLY